MTVRFHWKEGPNATSNALHAIIQTLNQDDRAQLIVPAGQAALITQRIRMQLSRVRNQLRSKGVPIKQFTIKTHSHHFTDLSGKRFDAVLFWKQKTKLHVVKELLEKKEQEHGDVY